MTSLKKLIAVLAISLPLAALAQQAAAPAAEKPPLAQIYGSLNLNLQNIGTVGSPHLGTAANPLGETNVQSRWAVSADSTNIGVKGTAAVQGGLSVVYQCETSAKLDGTGTNSLCDRNSRVGLTHPTYGTLFLGNWDTPFKAAYYGTKADDPFGSTDVFGSNNIMGSPGFRSRSGDANGFDIRAKNSVVYWTPKIQGFSAKAQVSVNEGADARFHGDPAVKQLDPWNWGAVVNYDQGPLSLLAAYEQHRDLQGLQQILATETAIATATPTLVQPTMAAFALPANAFNLSSLDQAVRVGAGYEVPVPDVGPLTVSAVYEAIKFTQRNTGLSQIQSLWRPALAISAKQRYGDHELRARFNWADKPRIRLSVNAAGTTNSNDVTGLDAHELTFGYAYYLAASTQVYVFYTKIVNGLNATYVPGAGGSLSGAPAVTSSGPATGTTAATSTSTGPAPGADPVAWGIGMKYTF
jgi:predicted porin